MDRIKHAVLFKAISLVLVVTFTALDISSAYGSGYAPGNSTLAPPSVMQNQPLSADAASLRQTVLYQGVFLASVYEIGDIFFGNPTLGKVAHPEKYAEDAVMADLGRQLNEKGIELVNIVPVEYIRSTAPEKLQAALDEIGFKGTLPDEGVVFALYRKNGKKFLAQIAVKGKVSSESLPGYEQTGSDRYLVKYITEDYEVSTAQVAEEAPAKPVPVVEKDTVPKSEPPKGTKLRSFEPFSILAAASLASWSVSGLIGFVIEHWFFGSIIGVATFLITWRVLFPGNWYVCMWRIAVSDSVFSFGDANNAKRSLIALGRRAVPALIKVVEKNGAGKRVAIEVLGSIGLVAKDAVPILILALKNADWYVREAAAKALGKIGPAAKDAVPALVTVLKDTHEDQSVRCAAAEALGKIGPDDKDVISGLVSALKCEKSSVRQAAAEALDKFNWNPDSEENKIAYLIAKRDWDGVVAVGQPAISNLVLMLKDEDGDVCQAAVEALGKIGPAAVPSLVASLEDEKQYVCKAAAQALDLLRWIPEGDENRSIYLIAKEDWNGVVKIGHIAIPYLVRAFNRDAGRDFITSVILAIANINSKTDPTAKNYCAVDAVVHLPDNELRNLVVCLVSDLDFKLEYIPEVAHKIVESREEIQPYTGKPVIYEDVVIITDVPASLKFQYDKAAVEKVLKNNPDFWNKGGLSNASVSEDVQSGLSRQDSEKLFQDHAVVGLREWFSSLVTRSKIEGYAPTGESDKIMESHPFEPSYDNLWLDRILEGIHTKEEAAALKSIVENLRVRTILEYTEYEGTDYQEVEWKRHDSWSEYKDMPTSYIAVQNEIETFDYSPFIEVAKDAKNLRRLIDEEMAKTAPDGEKKEAPSQTKIFSFEPFSILAAVSLAGWSVSGLIEFLREYWFSGSIVVVVTFFVGKPLFSAAWRGWFPVSWYISELKGRDPGEAVRSLAALGTRAVPALVKAVEKNIIGKRYAIEALGSIGLAAQNAVPVIVAALKDKDLHVRFAAAVALDKLNWKPDSEENKIVYLIAKRDWNGVAAAGRPAIPSLVIAFNKDTDRDTRELIVRVLAEIVGKNNPAVENNDAFAHIDLLSNNELRHLVVCLVANLDFNLEYIPEGTREVEVSKEVSWDTSYGLKYTPVYEMVTETMDVPVSVVFQYGRTAVETVLENNPDFWTNGRLSETAGLQTAELVAGKTSIMTSPAAAKPAAPKKFDPRYAPDVPFWELDASFALGIDEGVLSGQLQLEKMTENLRAVLDKRSWVWRSLSDSDRAEALNKILTVKAKARDILRAYAEYAGVSAENEIVSVYLAGSFPWVEAPNDLDVIIVVKGEKGFENISSATSQGKLKEIFPGLETTYEVVGLETLKKAIRGEDVERAKVVRRKAIIYSVAVPLYGADIFRNSRPPLESYGIMVDDFITNAQIADWDNIKGDQAKIAAKRAWRQRETEALSSWIVKEKFAAKSAEASSGTKLFSFEPFGILATASLAGWSVVDLMRFALEHWFLSIIGVIVFLNIAVRVFPIAWKALFPFSWYISVLKSGGHPVDAIKYLVSFGPRAVPALIKVVENNGAGKRSAIEALGLIGLAAKDAVPVLVKALKDEDSNVRQTAVEALGKIGPAAKDAVPALVTVLKDKHEYQSVRCAAAEALGKIGPDDEDVISGLVSALKCEKSSVRQAAAETLDKLNWKPDSEENKIAYLIAKRDWDGAAAIGESVIPSLILMLKDEDPSVRADAANVLGKIGLPAIPSLAIALEDQYMCQSAAEALVKIGLPAVPSLVTALENKNWYVSNAAAKALVKIGSAAIPNLVTALEGKAPSVRRAIVEVLRNIGHPAIPSLLNVLKNEKDQSVIQAASSAIVHLARYCSDQESMRIPILSFLKSFDGSRLLDQPGLVKMIFDVVRNEKEAIALRSVIERFGMQETVSYHTTTIETEGYWDRKRHLDWEGAEEWFPGTTEEITEKEVSYDYLEFKAAAKDATSLRRLIDEEMAKTATAVETKEASEVAISGPAKVQVPSDADAVKTEGLPAVEKPAKKLFEVVEEAANSRREKFTKEAGVVISAVSMCKEPGSVPDNSVFGAETASLALTAEVKKTLAVMDQIDASSLPEGIAAKAVELKKNLRQFETDGGVASLIVLARSAKREGQKLIIGLETDWIPAVNGSTSLQREAISALTKEIYAIGDTLRSMGLDNVEIVQGSKDQLAGALLDKARETGTRMKNIVVMASIDTVNSDSFSAFTKADEKDRPFLAGIKPEMLFSLYEKYGESLDEQLYVRLAGLLFLTLELAAGKEPPSSAVIFSYDKDKRLLILLPNAEIMDYYELKKAYLADKKALQSA